MGYRALSQRVSEIGMASCALRLPACCQCVRDVFVQEAAVAEEELEQEVQSFVLYTDVSASMSSGRPEEPALASWSVIVWAQCRSRMIPLFAVAAPVELDWELVAERTTLERFQRSLWCIWSFFFCAVFQSAQGCQRLSGAIA